MEIVFLLLALFSGAGIGFGSKAFWSKRAVDNAEQKAKQLIEDAKTKAKEQSLVAKEAALKVAENAQAEERSRRTALEAQEQRLVERERTLDANLTSLEHKTVSLQASEKEMDAIKDELKAIRVRQQQNLEKIAKLKTEDAEEKLMQITEKQVSADLVGLIEKLKRDAKEHAEEYAREVVSDAMQRVAMDETAERTITTVSLPSDDMKGKIIGKEGRNIQTLERLTGIDILVDDTPGVVVLSGFDPVRRQIARTSLEKLIEDGRIHPARIEEVVHKAEKEIDNEIRKAGEDAAREAKISGLPPEIIKLMGQLKFRTSYSQNVLFHSVEMAHLAAMVAADIGANVQVARTAAFLHDLGKAVTHEMEGAHHHITRILCDKYGIDEAITHAAEAHHDDVEATTPEALIVRAVDALSAGRPGARGNTVENYAHRMTELENLANTFPGVIKTYAMSAGREIRVFVTPEEVDDLTALKMARDIATRVEGTLKYPGVIKVNVIRETRAVEYAK